MVTSKRTIRISDEEWNEFKTLCEKNGVDCSSKIRELIREQINIEKELQPSNNQDIYYLLDNIYHRMGEIHRDIIERNTQPIQREVVLDYCKKKGYHITAPALKFRDHEENPGMSYYDGSRAVFGKE